MKEKKNLYHILDFIEDEAFTIESSYKVKFVNEALRKKISVAEGRCFELIEGRITPCSHPLWECPLKRVIREKRSYSFVHPYRVDATNDTLYLKVSIHPLSENEFLEIRRDVSAERKLEKHIILHHNHLDAISKISSAVSGLKDLRKILEIAMDTILDIFTGSIGAIMLFDEKTLELRYQVLRGLSLDFAKEKNFGAQNSIFGKVARDGTCLLISDLEKEEKYKSAGFFAEGVRSLISVPLKAKEKVVGVLNVMSSVAGRFNREDMYLLSSVGHQLGIAIEQARLYERLTNARERYKKLLEVTLAIQEEERKRIARELHDETSQNLTAISLNLQALKEMIEEEGLTREVKELIRKSHSIAVSASTELTRIIRELRPTLLDTLGLPAAINHLVESNLKARNIEAEFKFSVTGDRLSPETELALFRITQEALSNIVRHSKAKKAKILLHCDEKECRLIIEDDGVGFRVQDIKTIDEGGRGAGLFGMKERVKLVGGRCNVESSPGMGTRINVYVPRLKIESDEEDKGTDS